MGLKDKVEEKLQEKAEVRTVRKSYADKCRKIMDCYDEMVDDCSCVEPDGRYYPNSDFMTEYVEEIAEKCGELHRFYLDNEPALLNVEGLREKDKKIGELGRTIMDDYKILLDADINTLLSDMIYSIEKNN